MALSVLIFPSLCILYPVPSFSLHSLHSIFCLVAFSAIAFLFRCILYTVPSVSSHSLYSPFCLIAFSALFLLSHCIICTLRSVSLHSLHCSFCLIAFSALFLLSHYILCTVPSGPILCNVTILHQGHMFKTHVTKYISFLLVSKNTTFKVLSTNLRSLFPDCLVLSYLQNLFLSVFGSLSFCFSVISSSLRWFSFSVDSLSSFLFETIHLSRRTCGLKIALPRAAGSVQTNLHHLQFCGCNRGWGHRQRPPARRTVAFLFPPFGWYLDSACLCYESCSKMFCVSVTNPE